MQFYVSGTQNQLWPVTHVKAGHNQIDKTVALRTLSAEIKKPDSERTTIMNLLSLQLSATK